MPSYRVVIEGTTLPGFAPDDVRPRLAALVKRSEEVAAKLLSGQPSTVKSGVDQATGTRYLNALMAIGVACRVERETADIDVGMHRAEAPSPEHLQRSADMEPSSANLQSVTRPAQVAPTPRQTPVATPNAVPAPKAVPVTPSPAPAKAFGRWAVAVVMGFFSGVLISFLAALLFISISKDSPPAPSSGFVLAAFLGGWFPSTYIMQRGAISISKVVSRGFLIGAAEWLLMIPVGMIFAGKVFSGESTAGATIGGGVFAFLTGGVAVTMAVVCLIGFAVSYFIGREMKPEVSTATRKCPECAELIQPDAKKCRYCGALVGGAAP